MPNLIESKDIHIEPWPPRQTGGQQVGGGPCGVKIRHIPSGIEVCVSIGRSQHINREIALNMIEAAITHPKYRL